ncbi:STAS domain-containing protein [Kitasatospora sp. NPDC001603]|uniref:STAS domain-containing protein n=1 Tax=Kitasatospora sp. NPDC001603 TaxID=3154388 RepID=UPI003332917A
MSNRHGQHSNIVGTSVLRTTSSRIPGWAVVCCLHGEVDHDQKEKLESSLAEAVKAGQPRLIVDLSGLTFCDCASLNALLQTRQDAEAAGERLILAAPSPPVRRLLEITGTDEVFATCDSVRAALATAGTGPPAG